VAFSVGLEAGPGPWPQQPRRNDKDPKSQVAGSWSVFTTCPLPGTWRRFESNNARAGAFSSRVNCDLDFYCTSRSQPHQSVS
jgi:hypothetical protein